MGSAIGVRLVVGLHQRLNAGSVPHELQALPVVRRIQEILDHLARRCKCLIGVVQGVAFDRAHRLPRHLFDRLLFVPDDNLLFAKGLDEPIDDQPDE